MLHKRYAKTKSELAKVLGVSLHTVLKYSKATGRPENHAFGSARYDIEAWRQFIGQRKSAHNFGRNGHSTLPPSERELSMMDKNKALAERARILIERDQFRLAVERGEYFAKDEVLRAFDLSHSTARREIDKAIETELPPKLQGRGAIEIRKILRRWRDNLYRMIPVKYATNGA